jgi:hypothetical protein
MSLANVGFAGTSARATLADPMATIANPST